MQIIRNVKSTRSLMHKARRQNKTIGFVPTMGYLHEGHMSLIKKSVKDNDLTVMSIFVNPKQFGPREDFAKYPRNLRRDKLFAKKEKVDILFLPSAVEMYRKDHVTHVDVERLSACLCGAFRPGHFKGVATVVAKLLNIVRPDILYLGQKDAQQTIVIKKMISDLNFPLKVKVLPTVRAKDGLAMSSRNTYLNPQERKRATILFKSLRKAKLLIQKGERRANAIVNTMREMIRSQNPTKIDYIECRDSETLNPLSRLKGRALIALAVWFGKTRLIDNIIVNVR